MSPQPSAEVLVIGGGIGGLALAVALRRARIPARVFERSPALREVGAGVSLWPNAMAALREIGLFQVVLGEHEPIEEIVIRRRDGTVLMRLDDVGRRDHPAICVHRAFLQQVLAENVDPDRLHLDRRLMAMEEGPEGVTARFQDGSRAAGVLLLACDGIHSTVRGLLHGAGPPEDRGYRIWRSVARLDLSADLRGKSTEWWAPGRRFGILPGEPGTLYWYATDSLPQEAGDDFGRDGPAALFRTWPSPIPEILDASAEEEVILTRATDRPVAWGRGRVALLGDASHPTTPNMGQGACMAIEDAVVLARCLAEDGLTPAALRRYEKLRQGRTRWIVHQSRRIGLVAQLSSPGLVEIRDHLLRLLPDAVGKWAQGRVHEYRVGGLAPSPAFPDR